MKRVLVALLMTALISIGAMAALDTDDYVGGVYFLNLDQAVLMGFTSTGLFDMIGGARFDNTTLATTLTITETNIAFVGAVSLTGAMSFTGDVSVGEAGGSAGQDFFAYGKLDGSYLEWDEDANDAGRFKVVNASTRLKIGRASCRERV